MNIFDTHAHYDDESFNEDRDVLFNALKQNNVKYIINNVCNCLEKGVKIPSEYR